MTIHVYDFEQKAIFLNDGSVRLIADGGYQDKVEELMIVTMWAKLNGWIEATDQVTTPERLENDHSKKEIIPVYQVEVLSSNKAAESLVCA